ncbi:MAG: helix-turn-helix transcriptional regulator [Bacteroidetes bacterium]|nr:helix-turn-helix transcriptional regulator [Bacteroidota bacterium]
MKGVFVDGQFKPFRQIPALPDGYPGPIIRASTLFFVKGNFGRITCQRLVSGPYEIWHSVYEAAQDCRVRFHHKRAFLGVHAVLEGETYYDINGFQTVRFREQECNFYFLPLLDGTVQLEKRKRYQSLNMCLRAAQVKPYLAHFDTGKRFTKKLFLKEPVVLHQDPLLMGFALKGIIQEILTFTAAIDQQDLFLKIKIHEFLFYLFGASIPFDPIRPEIKDRLLEVKKIIDQQFTQHFTIRQLARKSGMNTTSFKTAFKKAFDMAPFEYLVEIRMQHAVTLLQKRDLSIQRVADAAGYKSFGSFIKAFKRRFGVTPGQIKKTFPNEP